MEDLSRELENPRQKTLVQVFAIGAILILGGAFILKSGLLEQDSQVQVISDSASGDIGGLIAEISGEVKAPGVYEMPDNSRIDDLITVAGGLTDASDLEWVEKNLNRAALILDGQKIYIPRIDEQSVKGSANNYTGDQSISTGVLSDSGNQININTASLPELDKLPGIGPKYGQDIIDQRPYSTPEDLLTKGVLKKSVFEKIKNLISVY